jgi:hypothetical protein
MRRDKRDEQMSAANAAPTSGVTRPTINSTPPAVSVTATKGARRPGAGMSSEAKNRSVPDMSPSLSIRASGR